MKNEIIEKFFIQSGQLLQVTQLDEAFAAPEPSIYEVIRVISGVPVFLEKHLERLEASVGMVGASIRSHISIIEKEITRVIRENGSPDKNIKIVVYNLKSSTPDYIIGYIKTSYPDQQQYSEGVDTVLYIAERSNPNAKVVNLTFKERVAQLLAETKAYEALLQNEHGEITEGSRSNVFFIKGRTLVTAPKESVLIGITRVMVVEICRSLQIPVDEREIKVDELRDMDAVFMTGTSPKILPIRSIDKLKFASADNPAVKELLSAYDKMISDYIASHKI